MTVVEFAYSVIALPFVLATVVQAILIGYVLAHPRTAWRDPVVRTLVYVLVAGLLWSAPYGLNLVVHDLPTSRFLFALEHLGPELLPPALLLHVVAYTGQFAWFTRRRLALLTVEPVITLGLLLTNDAHHLLWSDAGIVHVGTAAVFTRSVGPWWYFKTTYQYVLVGIALLLLVRAYRRADGIVRHQVMAAVAAILIPLGVNALFDAQFLLDVAPVDNFAAVEFTGAALAVSGLVLSLALVRYRYLDVVPAGRERAIEHLHDPYLVVDTERRILDSNRATTELFGGTTDYLGRRVTDLLPELAPLFVSVESDAPSRKEVSLAREPDRWFEATLLPIPVAVTTGVLQSNPRNTQWHDDRIASEDVGGYVIVLHEITELKDREQLLTTQRQQIERMNQLVSHDMRNELNLLAGLLRRSLDARSTLGDAAPDVRDAGMEFRRQADQSIEQMVTLIETHRDFIRAMSNRASDPVPTALRPVLTRAVATASTRAPEVEIDLDSPVPHVEVLATDMLTTVFRQLLHCATDHARDGSGRVRVAAAPTAETLLVRLTGFDPAGTVGATYGGSPEGELVESADHTDFRVYLVASLLGDVGGSLTILSTTDGTEFRVELRRA